jgi:O-acetyl-ADP-ribose deacetylase (regulator of RNase III)
MVTYVKGDATKPIGGGKKIIAHICNDEGGWGAGFTGALDKISSEPNRIYRHWYNYWTKKSVVEFLFMPLGFVCLAKVDDDTYVANMIAQHRTITSVPKPICYKSLEKCLNEVADFAVKNGGTVHMPRIGCGLAGGDWNVVESIINRTLTLRDIDVIVYDL